MSAQPMPLPGALAARPERSTAPPRKPQPAAHLASLAARVVVDAYRLHGHRLAALDPLRLATGDGAARSELDAAVQLARAAGADEVVLEWSGVAETLALDELVARCERVYCGTLAIQAAHVRSAEQRRWLYASIERARIPEARVRARILRELVDAETFETFQRARHPRQKQFSAEGCESMMPLLTALLIGAADEGAAEVALGMAHRGRLNALANVLGLGPEKTLALLGGAPDATLHAWDLKDHVGCTLRWQRGRRALRVVLAHNPSHLGSVTPVVCGMARAMQERSGSTRTVVPIVVHGDAAFPGQGIVVETLNLSQVRGYAVGGTVHVIVDNQIGSTIADRCDARSTLYAADAARAIDAPIVYVNADDPEAAVRAASLAVGFRSTFGADVVIDLVGFRRIGHFGGDDPTMTQPATQRRIRTHPGVAKRYADALIDGGIVDRESVEGWKRDALQRLEEAQRGMLAARPPADAAGSEADDERRAVDTRVPVDALRAIVERLARAPAGVALHASVERRRRQWEAVAAGNAAVDWCLAETLAYATLLRSGHHVRLTGLDVGRGTFFHRDAVWHDQAADRDGVRSHVPLRGLDPQAGHFALFETPLSEEAVVGFEYGYSLHAGRGLVVWEAQFGDFVNNAQAIVDQFIASGERKWGNESGLVLLLPHGAEGHGPEHSSGYVGRFLALCGDANLRVAMPSTAAQLHHLLRRQALTPRRKPLVVMTPKMALRSDAASFGSLESLAAGGFAAVIGDDAPAPSRVVRVAIASGKLVHALRRRREREPCGDVAIVALESLHPFPATALAGELARYPRLAHVCFAQEEPRNHGAWHLVREGLESVLPRGVPLSYAGPPAASPSGGCDPAAQAEEEAGIVAAALGLAHGTGAAATR